MWITFPECGRKAGIEEGGHPSLSQWDSSGSDNRSFSTPRSDHQHPKFRMFGWSMCVLAQFLVKQHPGHLQAELSGQLSFTWYMILLCLGFSMEDSAHKYRSGPGNLESRKFWIGWWKLIRTCGCLLVNSVIKITGRVVL